MHSTSIIHRRQGSARLRAAVIGLLGLGLAACSTDTLVDLQNPDLITGPVVRDSANAEQLYNGALFEFGRAVSGAASTNDNPGIFGISGLMADELWYSSTFSTMQDIDARDIIDLSNGVLATVFQRIHRARNLADRTYEQLNAISQGNTSRAAKAANLAGYSFIFLAENFCSGVPVSSTSLTGELVFGTALTTQQLLDSAMARFNTAIATAQAAGDADEEMAARVGIGRVLLDGGDFAGAAAAVATVPTDFEYDVIYSPSSTGQNNGLWQHIDSEKRSSAASGEGVNGLVYFTRGAPPNTIDPRVSVDSVGFGIGNPFPLYAQHKYNTRGAPIPLATGIEARLIEAEAALSQGASGAYVTTLNTLRADTTLNPLRNNTAVGAPLADPGTAAARVDQFFKEREFWLWLTGHRLSDMRRLVRQYGRDPNTVFPIGQTIFGSPYGNDVNLPIPFQERNNPNDTNGQCIDRNA
jgi:hypothetical protein